MPRQLKVAQTQKAARIATIVLLKREFGLLKTTELARILRVSSRTIQRDMHIANAVERLLKKHMALPGTKGQENKIT